MDTAVRSSRAVRWDLIRWEVGWTLCEMSGVALGLLLGLGLDNWSAGCLVLFGVLALSSVTRFRHYSNVSSWVRDAR